MNKRLHFLFINLIFSSFVLSQNNFTNAGGDNLWSNPANWSGGVPNGGTAVVIIKSALVIVDGDYSVKQIKLPGGQPSPTFTDGGGGLLTITGNNNIGSPIQINVNGGHITFDVNVVFDTSQAGATKKFHLNNGNTAFTFGAGYSLTIVDDELTFAAINLNNAVNFNGSILGNGILKFASKINANFGANYDGSNFDGEIHVGGATGNNRVHLTSNVSSNGTFLKANGLLSVVGSGSTIFINGANTLNGDIDLTSDKSAILDINANQSAIGTITMGSGTLNLAVDTAVTSVAFADNSGASWSTGILQITGAGDNEVSFGTSAGGVTNGQLAQITLGGSNPVINASGQLYNQGAGGNVNSTFNNGGGDNLWSNAANWTNGIPNGDQAKVTVSASPLIVDSDYTVGQIKFPGTGGGGIATNALTTANNSTLTITGKGVTQPIQLSMNNQTVAFNCNIIFDSTEGQAENFRFNAGQQSITFGQGYSLTVNDELTFSSLVLTNQLNFNGTILGTGNLKFGAKSKAVFGSTYSSGFVTDNIVAAGSNNVTLISNAATIKANITVPDSNTFTFQVNSNLSFDGRITMGAGGGLNLSAVQAVTSIAFANNSTSNWGTGTIAITGVADNEVSFGSNASGLTANQLAQITYNGCTEVSINENGKLSATGGCPAGGNNAPGAGVDYVTIVKNKYSDPIEVLKNDSDQDGDEISLVSASSAQSNGIIDVNVNRGTIVYIPAPEFTGDLTIIYTITDGTDQSNGVLYITVEENTVPIADAKNVTTIEDTPKEINLSATDANGDSLFYTLVDNPSNGVVRISGDGKATYTPNSDFFGSDSFTFKVNDGMDDSSTTSVTIDVTSNDIDNDGVLNVDDICPATTAGTAVDLRGCPVFDLPDNNNSIQVTSASCVGSNDGSLKFIVANSSLDYTVRLIGLRSQNQGISNHEILGASNSLSVTGLSEGLYSACFLVNGQPGYEQCFEVLIEQPEPLSAFIGINESNLTTNIELEGSDSYNIEVNGANYDDVRGNNFTATLRTGINNIKVSTDKNCQGLIEKQVFLSEEIQYYPNPTINDVNVHISGIDKRVLVSVYSIKGELIYSKEQEIEDFSRLTEIDLESQTTGTYIVTIESETVRKVFKIVKE